MKNLIFFLIINFIFFFPNEKTENLKKTVKYLSSKDLKGRMTGSEGAKKASFYIENELKKLGIEVQRQKFSFTSGNLLGKKNFLKFFVNGKEFKLKPNKDFKPLPYSSSNFAEGKLVFAGFGIAAKELNYDDYENLDIKDRIVLVLRYNPDGKEKETPFLYYDRIPDKILTAKDKGAKAIIFFTGLNFEKEKRFEGFGKEKFGANLGIPAIQISQKKAIEILREAKIDIGEIENKIMKSKKPASFETNIYLKIQTDLIEEKKECQNIIGIFKPEKWNGKYILLGAHYDHIGLGGESSRWEKKFGKIHPGADDNASGVALLLEISKEILKEKEKHSYGIIFAFFSGEEIGIIGSSYFVKKFKDLKDISIMLNFDMVGRMRDKKLILFGFDTSPQIEEVLNKVSKSYDFKIIKNLGGFSQGDNTAFYKENIPVLGFFTDIHNDYHTPKDTYEKINYFGMKEILNFAMDIILEFQKYEEIKFTESKAIPSGGGRAGMKVYVGTIPSFEEGVEGYKISGVQPGSPAEKGGLIKDDIIIKIDEKEIKNIYDFMYALKDKKGGEVVEFKVKRGEKEFTLKIKLEPLKDKSR